MFVIITKFSRRVNNLQYICYEMLRYIQQQTTKLSVYSSNRCSFDFPKESIDAWIHVNLFLTASSRTAHDSLSGAYLYLLDITCLQQNTSVIFSRLFSCRDRNGAAPNRLPPLVWQFDA